MICFAKPALTEDLYIVHKEKFSITCYVCYVHLIKAKSIHKRQTHPLIREDVTQLQQKRKEKPLVMGLKGLGAKTN
jgi:hypothetical protein